MSYNTRSYNSLSSKTEQELEWCEGETPYSTGGHLAELFLKGGHDVTVLDNFEPFYAEGIKR